jgi:hypothetical protein
MPPRWTRIHTLIVAVAAVIIYFLLRATVL